MAERIHSPSDLDKKGGPRGKARFAGRVVAQQGDVLEVADALGSVRVRLQKGNAASVATLSWVVIEATRVGRKWLHAQILEQRISDGAHDFERAFGLGVGAALRARAEAQAVIRRYFDERGFVHVDTPCRVMAPGTDVHIEPVPVDTGFLITSPEFQMKRLVAGGMPRIYQFAHVFRSGERGPRHETEFSMLEWYRAHEGYEAVMADTEQIIRRTLKALCGTTRLQIEGRNIDCKPPFLRITVQRAFEEHAGIADVAALAATNEDRYFDLLVGKVEPALSKLSQPVFLVDYPLSQAALARPCPNSPGYAERFELYLGGLELCNGYGELTDAHEQRARFVADNERRKQRGARELPIDERFLSALQHGLPPCAGNALGFDRLMMLALGAPTIDRVMAFPSHEL